MAATLASAVTLVFLGKVVDRYPISFVAAAIIAALSLACVGMSFASSLPVLFLVLFALRLFGQGMMTHTSQTAIGKWYAAERGRAISFTSMGHQLGEAVFPSAILVLVGWIGWRNTWQIAAVSLIVVALPSIYLLMRVERSPEKLTAAQAKKFDVRNWSRKEVLKDSAFWGLLLSILAPAFIGTAVFFHQDHLIEAKSWNPRTYASAYIVLAIATVTFTLLGGWIVDRFSSKFLLPVFLLPMGLGCFILGASDGEWAIYAFMSLLGFSYGLSSSLFGTIWPETYGIRNLGSIRAMAVAAMVFASALGPGLTGWCIDREITFSFQLAVMGGYCLITSVGMIAIAKSLLRRSALADTTAR